ncbi:MAG: potassium channel protein [Acidobacteriota bacterium]|jgi:voltage-gated potassium channel
MFKKHAALKKLLAALFALFVVYVVGTVGYMLLEHWNFTDASYMTVITISTVGYAETHPLSPTGRWFTTFLILGGVGVLIYGVTNLAAFIVEGELRALFKRSRMDKRIEKVAGHFILCGAGRVGRNIARELLQMNYSMVILDKDPERLEALEKEGLATALPLLGDATDDRNLEKAGIKRAAGLVTALLSDSDNLYVVLSARQMNPTLRIIARVTEEELTEKMIRAGADKAVCPSHIGGLRMASELIRPKVIDFLETLFREKDGTLRLEEAVLGAKSKLSGKTLAQVQIPKKTGCVVVALRRRSGAFEFNPSADTRLEEADTLIVIGDAQRVEILRNLAG